MPDHGNERLVVMTEPDQELLPSSLDAIREAWTVFDVAIVSACSTRVDLEAAERAVRDLLSESGPTSGMGISIDWATSEVVLHGDPVLAESLVEEVQSDERFRIEEAEIGRSAPTSSDDVDENPNCSKIDWDVTGIEPGPAERRLEEQLCDGWVQFANDDGDVVGWVSTEESFSFEIDGAEQRVFDAPNGNVIGRVGDFTDQ